MMPSHRTRNAVRASMLLLLAGLSACARGANAEGSHDGSDSSARPYVEVVDNEAEGRVDVRVDGQPFTSYIHPERAKKPTLFPLRTATGKIVTRGYPLEPRVGERTDHPHQIGLWLNYGNVNGVDFWGNSDERAPADVPHLGTVEQRTIRGVESGPGEGALEITAEWVDHDGKVLLREETRYVFRAAPDLRGVDRITKLTALDTAVTFHDTKEGMLGLRVARSLEQPATAPVRLLEQDGSITTVAAGDTTGVTGRYRSSEGLVGDSVWGTRARWAALDGRVEGEPVTIAILDHPSNPGFPTYWHARGYGLFAANPLGQKDFSNGVQQLELHLDPGASTTFRYRILILTGSDPTRRIEAQYDDFTR